MTRSFAMFAYLLGLSNLDAKLQIDHPTLGYGPLR
jgi:hypothetical protein